MNRHVRNAHSAVEIEKYEKSKTVIKTDTTTQETPKPVDKKIQDNPNAINVIKTSVISEMPNRNAVPVINAPIKLAFKKEAFKNNYNISKRDVDAPRIDISKAYNMAESLNICQRILLPMNPNDDPAKSNPISKNVITSVGKVTEKDSLEICKRILHPIDPSSIHYETSFENKQHASIKNMKYKINLSTYENMAKTNATEESTGSPRQYTELQPVRLFPEVESPGKSMEHQSVIVNPQNCNDVHADKNVRVPPFNEMHWRKRTSQYSNLT